MSSPEDIRSLYARAVSQSPPASAHPDEPQWERVFSDIATADERRQLMEHVVSCAACADIYRRLTVVRREASTFDAAAPRPRAEVRDYRVAYLAAAAVIALAVIPTAWRAWRTEPTPTPTVGSTRSASETAPALRDLPAFRLDKPPVILAMATVLTPRGAADEHQAYLREVGPALDAYRADRFDEAALGLEPLAAKYPTAVEPLLYGGISHLLAHRPDRAVPLLERALTLATGEQKVEADWRLSLAYVHDGAPEKARAGLERLCGAVNPYQTRACDALAALPSSR